MRILVTGATGFIGSALVRALVAAGHRVVAGIHHTSAAGLPDGVETMQVDFMRDLEVERWLSRLKDTDVVVNAVGILRESDKASFEALHHRAPAALFRACERAGVYRVIQVSALGADEAAESRYHLTKKAADDVLRSCTVDWTIVQPSVVFGEGGESTRMFLRMASLPVLPRLGCGDCRMQPIHIDDLVAVLLGCLEAKAPQRRCLVAVGPDALHLHEMLTIYRRALGFRFTLTLPVQLPLLRWSARMGDLMGHGALSTEALGMLLRGNVGAAEETAKIIGRSPRAPDAFITADTAPELRRELVWAWWRPLLVMSVAFTWIAAGVLSWLYAQERGPGLLMILGLDAEMAAVAFAAACAVNLMMGLVTLLWPRPGLWLLQLGLVLFYSAALTVAEPGLWADPFGPLVKNLAFVAVLAGLAATEG